MTREEILAMQPGRELDALVAEKVMGGIPWGPFEPSTDISAAWEVVEKFPIVQIEYVEIFEGNKNVSVTIQDGNGTVYVQTRTAPEAICKAALLAVMEVSA